jgi:hypothetical protein
MGVKHVGVKHVGVTYVGVQHVGVTYVGVTYVGVKHVGVTYVGVKHVGKIASAGQSLRDGTQPSVCADAIRNLVTLDLWLPENTHLNSTG